MHPTASSTPAARTPLRGLIALTTLGALLAGCSDDGADRPRDDRRGPSASAPGPVATHASPGAGRPVPRGKGSKDPDDLNGDGHRDVVVPLVSGRDGEAERLAVVYGSAKGLDPSVHAVYGSRDLGFSGGGTETGAGYAPSPLNADSVTTADLDGDGFPDVVTTVSQRLSDKEAREAQARDEGTVHMDVSSLRVAWGGPRGPRRGSTSTPIRVDAEGTAGVGQPVRGDFDGDGHHDLAALRQGGGEVVLLYGPFARAGTPARTGTRPGARFGTEGWLAADAIAPDGEPRATALLVHDGDDGEQAAATLYRARTGSGPAREGARLRKGNAVAFGDFDGDGTRDVAIGDDQSRNNEPGYETEAPEVDGSLAIYPGTGGAPRTYEIPDSKKGDYGPGGYHAADPDGDGRDAVVVSTDGGALLLDPGAGGKGGQRADMSRTVPARMDGKKVRKQTRSARPYGAADFDGDGKDELIFGWGADGRFSLYGEMATHWWITDGTSTRDRVAFSTLRFATPKE